jgi:hypothetical protein
MGILLEGGSDPMLAAASSARPGTAALPVRARAAGYFVGPGFVWVGLGSGSGSGLGDGLGSGLGDEVAVPPELEVPPDGSEVTPAPELDLGLGSGLGFGLGLGARVAVGWGLAETEGVDETLGVAEGE